MANNEKEPTEAGENQEIIPPLNKDETLEKLKLVAAETDEIKHSQKRKFDEITEKLQSIEKSISKITKFDENEKRLMEKSVLLNNQRNKEFESEKRFLLEHVFKNMTNLEEDEWVYSETVKHFNLKWKMEIRRIGNGLVKFYVHCIPIAPIGEEWTVETLAKFRKMGRRSYKKNASMMEFFFDEQCNYDSEDFLWGHVEDRLINDSLAIQLEVEIRKMIGFEKKMIRKFDESQKDVSDVILTVQDTKFYVLKMYLALQSSYFKALFFGRFDESEQSEIKLNAIEADDFQNFLELIHGESSINDDTVTGILHLADMYDAPTAIRRCTEFLLKNSQKSMAQKLQLALRCNLEDLKNDCLSKITRITDIESIMSANLPEMDLSTSQALLQKSIELWDE